MVSALLAVSPAAFGLGGDYPNNRPVGGASTWPSGMKGLVNTSARVHGYFVNAEDQFFFSGDARQLSEFLDAYAKINPIQKHVVILQNGKGVAKSPWAQTGQPCDWMIYGCPESWLTQNAKDKAYILEVHVWTGGQVAFDKVVLPAGVQVVKKE